MRHMIKMMAAASVAVGALMFLSARRAGGQLVTLTLASSSFHNGGTIPEQYTCDGINISPALHWTVEPPAYPVGSFVLIVDDPDARKVVGKTFVHWVAVFASSIMQMPEGNIEQIMAGRKIGFLLNDYNQTSYKGPCPPAESGEHTYRFTLFAVKQNPKQMKAEIKTVIDADEFEKGMTGNIIAKARITGRYKRK